MKYFGIGMMLGAVLGGIIGLVFAPQKGTATRDQVKEVAHAANEKVRIFRFDLHKGKPESDEYIRQAI